ncbi:cAMP specific phosphodiesterase [Angomonas deanei]|uniref:Uncharacterized protein n=1 Tax=Angomonas deanei TaxID=59799 RepID=A0A7G2CU53_9TRYP|nr:cAMP specific phosphodiesterase [Angomonas deanei]CAD2221993.1 hypothetical protein, conserved [Angomonas deanei]|eukprot:EPY38396.1 cAMP specific phosphodiesterase [Angomonas deanei]
MISKYITYNKYISIEFSALTNEKDVSFLFHYSSLKKKKKKSYFYTFSGFYVHQILFRVEYLLPLRPVTGYIVHAPLHVLENNTHDFLEKLTRHKINEPNLAFGKFIVLTTVEHGEYLNALGLFHVSLSVKLFRHRGRPETGHVKRLCDVGNIGRLDHSLHHLSPVYYILLIIRIRDLHKVLQQLTVTGHIGRQHTVNHAAVRIGNIIAL